MLNDLDTKIIRALQQDGRATHVALASRLGIHVSTIAKKMKLFQNQGIINIRALPNPYKLGYDAHAVIGIKVDYGRVGEICDRISSNLNVNLIVTTFGPFDIVAAVFFPNWERLFSFVHTSFSSNDGIREIQTFFVKDILKRRYGFLQNRESPAKIDELDCRLIELLAENGRYTANYLSKALSISIRTCLRRLQFLLNEKVIAVKALPNPTKIGRNTNALLLMRIQPSKAESVCKVLKSYNEIFLFMTLHNGYDIFLGLNADSPTELFQMIHGRIMTVDGILSTDTLIRAEIKKRYYGGVLDNDGLKDKYDGW